MSDDNKNGIDLDNLHESLIPPEYPKLEVGDDIHICNINNFCMLAKVAGLAETYEKDGKVVVYLMPPIPTAVATCLPNMPEHYTPANKDDKKRDTWHSKSECIGGCKRMVPGNVNRLVH